MNVCRYVHKVYVYMCVCTFIHNLYSECICYARQLLTIIACLLVTHSLPSSTPSIVGEASVIRVTALNIPFPLFRLYQNILRCGNSNHINKTII